MRAEQAFYSDFRLGGYQPACLFLWVKCPLLTEEISPLEWVARQIRPTNQGN